MKRSQEDWLYELKTAKGRTQKFETGEEMARWAQANCNCKDFYEEGHPYLDLAGFFEKRINMYKDEKKNNELNSIFTNKERK